MDCDTGLLQFKVIPKISCSAAELILSNSNGHSQHYALKRTREPPRSLAQDFGSRVSTISPPKNLELNE